MSKEVNEIKVSYKRITGTVIDAVARYIRGVVFTTDKIDEKKKSLCERWYMMLLRHAYGDTDLDRALENTIPCMFFQQFVSTLVRVPAAVKIPYIGAYIKGLPELPSSYTLSEQEMEDVLKLDVTYRDDLDAFDAYEKQFNKNSSELFCKICNTLKAYTSVGKLLKDYPEFEECFRRLYPAIFSDNKTAVKVKESLMRIDKDVVNVLESFNKALSKQ